MTGGISLEDGGLWIEDSGAEVWGSKPVRMIGGCSNVEIAVPMSPDCVIYPWKTIPFCPISVTVPMLLCEVSSVPPMELTELAVDRRLAGNLLLDEPGLDVRSWLEKYDPRCENGDPGDPGSANARGDCDIVQREKTAWLVEEASAWSAASED